MEKLDYVFFIPTRLNQALSGPVHKSLIINDIFPNLTHVHYITHPDASFGYHNLKLDERSSYVITFALQIQHVQICKITVCYLEVGGMFDRKIDENLQRTTKCFWHCR